jgi:hypothetical protein
MKKRKFAEGGVPEGGRFDEDTYARARKFVEDGGAKEVANPAAKRAASKTVKDSAPTRPERMAGKTADDSVEPTAATTTNRGNSFNIGSKEAENRVSDMMVGDAEDRRMNEIGKKQALEGVYPEALLFGGAGVLRGVNGVSSGVKALRTAAALRKSAQEARSKAADSARLPKDIMDILNRPAKNAPTPRKNSSFSDEAGIKFKKGGGVKKYAHGGKIDGIAQRGKTRGKMC